MFAAIAQYSKDAPYLVAEVYAVRGEKNAAFEWLARAYSVHDSGLTEMKVDPLLKGLHGEPRFAALLRKMRLPS